MTILFMSLSIMHVVQPLTKTSTICRIRSIICLNLPSFSGGFNPWGTPNKRKSSDVCLFSH